MSVVLYREHETPNPEAVSEWVDPERPPNPAPPAGGLWVGPPRAACGALRGGSLRVHFSLREGDGERRP